MRRFCLTSVAAAALIAASFSAAAVMSPATAAPVATAGAAATSGGDAGISSRAIKRKATKHKVRKRRALKRCRKKHTVKKRKTCRKRVHRKFRVKRKPPVKPGPVTPAVTVDVGDDYFAPDVVNLKRGDVIRWDWNELNHDPHNVTVMTAPNGVQRGDYQTGSSPAVGFSFSRRFIVPGAYTFACSLHVRMTMTVVVS